MNKIVKPDEISINEMQKAIERSGYLIETRVSRVLLERGFVCNQNYSIPDKRTAKPREVDMIAWRTLAGLSGNDCVNLNLCIECANNPQPVVLFPRKDRENLVLDFGRELKLVGISREGLTENQIQSLFRPSQALTTETEATQYCSFSWKKDKGPWMAHHDDSHFQTFDKLLELEEYYRTNLFGGNFPEDNLHIEFFFFVCILGGKLMECSVDSNTSLTEIPRGRIFFSRESVDCLNVVAIDIVQESSFSEFLSSIDKEIETKTSTVKELRTEILLGNGASNREENI